MVRIALTGNVASGKSAVARVWADQGVPVVSADCLSRRAVAPGSPALSEIRGAFGDPYVTESGELDRARMRDLVFRDPAARERLEAIVHPRVEELRQEWIGARSREGAPLVALEIPLLFELGMEDDFDVVVVVDAPEATRERRLVEERGLDPAEARRMIGSQGDPEAKRRGADYVIENDQDLATLEREATRVLDRIRERASDPGGSANGRHAENDPGRGLP